jgi:hypothetical protein
MGQFSMSVIACYRKLSNRLKILSNPATKVSWVNASRGVERPWVVFNLDQTYIWELSRIDVTTKTHRAVLPPTLSPCD